MKLDGNSLKTITLFESVTGAHVRDYIDSRSMFIIEAGQMGKAIGKGGANIKKISHMLKKDVKLIEFSDNIETFVRSLLDPIKPNGVHFENGVLELGANDVKHKGKIYGREKSNIAFLKEILSRSFDVKEIKVV